jgi:hypothetical protein
MEVVGEKYDLFDAVGRDSFIYEATYICSVEEHLDVRFSYIPVWILCLASALGEGKASGNRSQARAASNS